MEANISKIAAELQLEEKKVQATVVLLDEGATIPFIARYRKEVTGSMDEVVVAAIRDRIEQLREMDKRRETILKSIEEQGKLTDELKQQIMEATTLSELEDLYLPYKPKRKTRASVAREKGLEPLALRIFAQDGADPLAEALAFIDAEKGVADAEEALAGARDIIAEMVNEDQEARKNVRRLFEQQGEFICRVIPGKEEEGQKYKDYFDWKEPLIYAPSHRILAMRRAEKELIVTLDCAPEEEAALDALRQQFVKGVSPAGEQVWLALKDGYKRLLKPSMETEIRVATKQKADLEAIKVFADNLKQLLMAAPLGGKRILAIDPGFRTGCKVVCIDEQGKLLANDTIYPNEPMKKLAEAASKIDRLCKAHQIQAIAIGNGTAGRETETFIRQLNLPKDIQVVMVNESGASVYSASETAREEFPDYDLTVRGAVSIGRRLMDPLAELVKIDPKAIGVGQYQHDVDQTALKKSLDDTVMSCVNAVGVDVNTASKELLTYVSGLNSGIAKNIVEFRNENGPFKKRQELKKVPRLGEKTFEQAAGFLRIRQGEHPLDASAVHPESYHIVEKMAADLQCSVRDLMSREDLRKMIRPEKYITEKVGLPTLQDILSELAKPGRDPREQFEAFAFAEGVEKPEDLRVGMRLPGIVTNITNFGAFVDVGVHQDGLVHLSHCADRFIQHPSDVLKVHQKVMVTVLEVDIARKRISLSLKQDPAAPKTERREGKTVHKPEHHEGKVVHKKEKRDETYRRSEKKSHTEQEPESMADKLKQLKDRFSKQ